MASIVRDDPAAHITTGGGTWSVVFMERFFGGSATWPAFAIDNNGDTGTYGSLSMPFHGTSVAFFGNTPIAEASQWALFSIDGGTPYNSSYMDPAPPSSRQWFKSPTLPDTTHTINISHIAGTSVDFVVITAGRNTPLSGERLIVDDGDPSITYSGSWTVNTNTYTSRDNPHIGLPYGNATHQTCSTDASATFRFSGTSAALYGLFSFDIFGTISATYTMDGFPTNATYTVNASSPEFTSGVKQLENYLLYSNDSLSSGDHTLQLQITNCVSQTFALDYIIYTPSFATLASKPSLPLSSPSNSGSPNPSSTLLQTGSLSSLQSSSPSSTLVASKPGTQSNASTSASPKAAIVGGVLGGVTFLVLLLLFCLLWRRNSKRRTLLQPMSPGVFPTDTPGPLSIQPFVLSTPTTGSHSPQTETKMGSPISPSRRQVLSPSNNVPRVISSDFSSSTGERETGRLSRSQVQRLQILIQDFNREINATSPDRDNTSFDSARITELHGRIAELTREHPGTDDVSQTSLLPPAYEANPRQLGYLGQTKGTIRYTNGPYLNSLG